MRRSYRVRLDPWAAEYEGAIGLLDDETPDCGVDLRGECADWRAVRPRPAPPPKRVCFIDGVRRIDYRLFVEEGDRQLFGLFGSFGVGATLLTRTETLDRAVIERAIVTRIAAVGGGLAIEPFAVQFHGSEVTFAPEAVPDNEPTSPLRGLQNAMRRQEAELAAEMAAKVDAVFLDGPLTSHNEPGPVVGYVKRLMRPYLPPAEAALLPALELGERTPMFSIQGSPAPRWSWYARIGHGRNIDSGLAGVVRLETSGRHELTVAQALADLATQLLPLLASDAAHDPRAPQNLYPIGALETHLRHRLGDPLLLRRAIEARIHGEQFA